MKKLTIADIVSPKTAKIFPKEAPHLPFLGLDDVEAHTMKLLGVKDAGEMKSSAKTFAKGDVLYSRLRPYLNKVWRADRDGLCSAEFIVLPENSFIDGEFLKYRLNARDFVSFANSLNAGDRPRVDFEQISSFSLPPFSLAHQRRIVAKIEELFSELDAGVASLKQARTQLATYRQSLLKQAFEGKLTAPWRRDHPEQLESPEQLLTRIQQERETRYQQSLQTWQTAIEEREAGGKEGKKPAKPRKLKPSEAITQSELKPLTELPQQWIYARLGESIVGIDAGKSFSCEERRPSQTEIGVAKVSAVTWGTYDEAESKTCRDKAKINPDYFINEGDFILSRANTIDLVGAAVIVRRTTQKIMLSDKTLRIRFAGILQEYILQYLRSRIGRLQIMSRSTGNQESMRNIGQDRISAIVAPLCSLPEQQEIVRLLEEQFTTIEQNEREIETSLQRAEALRQSILKRAFSGQLVPQDPTDEPAAQLLARIQQEGTERKAQAPKKPKKKATKKKTTKAKKS